MLRGALAGVRVLGFPFIKLLAPLGAKLLLASLELRFRLGTAASLLMLLLAGNGFISRPTTVLIFSHDRFERREEPRVAERTNRIASFYREEKMCVVMGRYATLLRVFAPTPGLRPGAQNGVAASQLLIAETISPSQLVSRGRISASQLVVQYSGESGRAVSYAVAVSAI